MTRCARCGTDTARLTTQRYCGPCARDVAARAVPQAVAAWTPAWRQHLRAKDMSGLAR